MWCVLYHKTLLASFVVVLLVLSSFTSPSPAENGTPDVVDEVPDILPDVPPKSGRSIHQGETNGDEVWYQSDSPHHVLDDFRVNPGDRLTIEKGCEVIFEQGASLRVYGTLNLTAFTPFEAITTFTGVEDRTGCWDGLYLYGDRSLDEGLFENAFVEFAMTGLYTEVSVLVHNVTFSHDRCAIMLAGGALVLFSSSILENEVGLDIDGGNVSIASARFEGNTVSIDTSDGSLYLFGNEFVSNRFDLCSNGSHVQLVQNEFVQAGIPLKVWSGHLLMSRNNLSGTEGSECAVFSEGSDIDVRSNNISDFHRGLWLVNSTGNVSFNDIGPASTGVRDDQGSSNLHLIRNSIHDCHVGIMCNDSSSRYYANDLDAGTDLLITNGSHPELAGNRIDTTNVDLTDLTVSDIIYDGDDWHIDDEVTCRVIILNNGSVEAPQVNVTIMLHDLNGGVTHSTEHFEISLQPYAQVELEHRARIPTSGYFQFIVHVDPLNEIPEHDDGNTFFGDIVVVPDQVIQSEHLTDEERCYTDTIIECRDISVDRSNVSFVNVTLKVPGTGFSLSNRSTISFERSVVVSEGCGTFLHSDASAISAHRSAFLNTRFEVIGSEFSMGSSLVDLRRSDVNLSMSMTDSNISLYNTTILNGIEGHSLVACQCNVSALNCTIRSFRMLFARGSNITIDRTELTGTGTGSPIQIVAGTTLRLIDTDADFPIGDVQMDGSAMLILSRSVRIATYRTGSRELVPGVPVEVSQYGRTIFSGTTAEWGTTDAFHLDKISITPERASLIPYSVDLGDDTVYPEEWFAVSASAYLPQEGDGGKEPTITKLGTYRPYKVGNIFYFSLENEGKERVYADESENGLLTFFLRCYYEYGQWGTRHITYRYEFKVFSTFVANWPLGTYQSPVPYFKEDRANIYPTCNAGAWITNNQAQYLYSKCVAKNRLFGEFHYLWETSYYKTLKVTVPTYHMQMFFIEINAELQLIWKWFLFPDVVWKYRGRTWSTRRYWNVNYDEDETKNEDKREDIYVGHAEVDEEGNANVVPTYPRLTDALRVRNEEPISPHPHVIDIHVSLANQHTKKAKYRIMIYRRNRATGHFNVKVSDTTTILLPFSGAIEIRPVRIDKGLRNAVWNRFIPRTNEWRVSVFISCGPDSDHDASYLMTWDNLPH